MSEFTVRLPPLDELALRWPEVAPLLKQATDRSDGCFEPYDLLRMAIRGQPVAIWFIEREGELVAAAAVEVRQYPRKRVFDISFVGGRQLRSWWPVFVGAMERQARECGCAAITACGRRGWEGFWRKAGVPVRTVGALMVRDL